MKNIIIYAGYNHNEIIIFIINKYFGFNLEKQILGECCNIIKNVPSKYWWESVELFYKFF